MNVWVAFVLYLSYRLCRLLLHTFQQAVVWQLNGVSAHLAKIFSGYPIHENCQVLSIIYRKKIVEGDMTSSNDFIWWHDKFDSAAEVLALNPHWTLFTLDKDFAYFIYMPQPWPFYNARRAPFVLMRQFKEGTKLARMPLKAFCKFAKESMENPKGPVVFCSSGSRTGSTLLTRLMQVSEERIVCFGEPDAFTVLTMLFQRGFVEESLAIELLKAIFKFCCKTQMAGQTCFIKVRSNSGRLVPLVKKAMPQVKHVFIYRRNTRRVLTSLQRTLRGANAGDVMLALWNIWPELACKFINAGGYEYEMCQRFGIRDVVDYAIIAHLAPFYYYYRSRDLFEIPVIYYEDLVMEKEKTLRSLFEVCELPCDQFIGEALSEFSGDSQAGTPLSQDIMKSVKAFDLDDSKVEKFKFICDQLQIPPIDIQAHE